MNNFLLYTYVLLTLQLFLSLWPPYAQNERMAFCRLYVLSIHPALEPHSVCPGLSWAQLRTPFREPTSLLCPAFRSSALPDLRGGFYQHHDQPTREQRHNQNSLRSFEWHGSHRPSGYRP